MERDAIYKGWVPAVGQRLSYSFIGESHYPKPTISRNIEDRHSRHIISCQHRPDLLDSAIPFFKRELARLFFGLVSDFWFICVAKCDNADVHAPLKGMLYLVEDTKTWNRDIRPIIDEAFASLDKFHALNHQGSNTTLDDYVNDNIAEKLESLKTYSLYSAGFSLERDGVVTISPSSYALIKNSKPDTEFYRNCIISNVSNQYKVCAQLFYFLKDISHTHHHHHPKTDTLVGLYPKSPGESDLVWINKTLKILYSQISEYERNRDEEAYASILGLLAYIDAFIAISEKNLGVEEHSKLARRDNDTLRASIHASQLDDQADANRREKLFDSMQYWFFSIIGLLIAIAGLGSLMEDQIHIDLPDGFNWVEFLANVIINLPLETLAFIAILVSLMRVRYGILTLVYTSFSERNLRHHHYGVKEYISLGDSMVFVSFADSHIFLLLI